MMIFNDGRQTQGEALPATARHGTIQPVTALSKRQRGWRIKHPQAVTTPWDNLYLFPRFSEACRGSIRIWGHGSGAKENAPTVLFLCPALLCGYPIRLVVSRQGITP